MKKIAMLFFFVLAFAALLTFTALADGEPPLTTNVYGTVSCTTADGKVTGYTASCTQNVIENNQYVLLVVKADGEGNALPISENTIMYIDQKAAEASGIEFAGFMPRSTPDCVVLLGGTFSDGESPKTLGTIAGQGVTVSGTVTSYGTNADVTVKLNDKSKTVTSTLVPNSNPAAYSGSFAFEGVSDGTYTLEISKLNHVTKTLSVEVEDEGTLEVAIYLKGDTDKDGSVDIVDVIRLLNHVNNSNPFAQEDRYLGLIDSDESIDIVDVICLLNHVNNSIPMYR